MESTEQKPQETPVVQAPPAAQVPPRGNSLGIPVAIVIAAALIAGAIIYTGSQKTPAPIKVGTNEPEEQITGEILPVTDKDHIRGNPNAPIVIVEYSDYDCPFCKNFHETMNKIMADYGADGKVAWVFRQFPLEQLHPNAPKTAAAAECVASLGGNEAFWKFSDLVYQDRATNEPTKVVKLPEYAEKSGVNKTKFNDCVSKGTFTEAIKADVKEAMAAGAQGTPYSILIAGDQQGIINGAQPYATVKQMIDNLLAQMEGQ